MHPEFAIIKKKTMGWYFGELEPFSLAKYSEARNCVFGRCWLIVHVYKEAVRFEEGHSQRDRKVGLGINNLVPVYPV